MNLKNNGVWCTIDGRRVKVDGLWHWKNLYAVPSKDLKMFTAVFVPYDTKNYSEIEMKVPVTSKVSSSIGGSSGSGNGAVEKPVEAVKHEAVQAVTETVVDQATGTQMATSQAADGAKTIVESRTDGTQIQTNISAEGKVSVILSGKKRR